MTITTKQFHHIALLAYLDPKDVSSQFNQCTKIIEHIEHLQTVDTSKISPLHHPTSVTQYLRPDNQVIQPKIADLAQCALEFQDDLYTVPLIIKSS